MPEFRRYPINVASSRERRQHKEWMDDFSIRDERLRRALYDLRGVGRWLGGYATLREGLRPFLARGRTLRVLDLGSGLADGPEHLARWGDRRGTPIEVVALEANDATVAYARSYLDERLPPSLRTRVEVVHGDALKPPFEDGTFDVVTASLFLHHFEGDEAVTLLHVMDRLARCGIVVSDLHWHPLAYAGIWVIGHVLPVSAMFAHDGPLSVRRGFTRGELTDLARQAGLSDANIGWHWAFRWLLTSRKSC